MELLVGNPLLTDIREHVVGQSRSAPRAGL